MSKEIKIISFAVIDNKTGEYPDLWKIALTEDWAKGLMYCDMDGFAILEDGGLILMDECGKFAYCPSDRFTVVLDEESKQSEGEWEIYENEDIIQYRCPLCKTIYAYMKDGHIAPTKCKNCSAKMTEVERYGSYQKTKFVIQIL